MIKRDKLKIILFEKHYAYLLSGMIFRVINQLEKENPEINYDPVKAEDAPAELIKASLDGKMWIALLNGEIVGTLSLHGKRLRRFFVHPNFQGRGIGRRLMKVAVEYAGDNNISEIWVGSLMRAVPIYRKLGFIQGKVFFNREINQEEVEFKIKVK